MRLPPAPAARLARPHALGVALLALGQPGRSRAEDFYVPSDATPTIGEAIAAAAVTPGDDTIIVSPPYAIDDTESQGIHVSELSLRIESANSETYDLPPLYGSDADLEISRARIAAAAPWPGDPLGNGEPCALCLDGGSLQLHQSAVEDLSSYGILTVDADLTLVDVTVSGNGGEQPLYAMAWDQTVVVDLTGTTFAGNTAGALRLVGLPAASVTATLSDTEFSDNAGGMGAAIYVLRGTLAMNGGTVSGNVADSYAPLYLQDSSASFDDVVFEGNAGVDAGLLGAVLDGGTVAIRGGSVTGTSGGPREVRVVGEGSFSVEEVYWAPGAPLEVSSGTWQILDSVFWPSPDATGVFIADSSEVTAVGNHVCAPARDAASMDAFVALDGGSLFFLRNVIVGLEMTAAGSAVFRLDGPPEPADFPSAAILDNTLVDVVAGDLVRGGADGLTFQNNLVDNAVGSFDLVAYGVGSDLDYNLWNGVSASVDGAAWPAGTGVHDVTGDPAFASSFDRAACPSTPSLSEGSPAIDAGNPAYDDTEDGGRSDIGAEDYGSGPTDTGPSDTGPADTGPADSQAEPDPDGDGVSTAEGDCDDADGGVFPGAPDEPGDGVDQNCDGADATMRFHGGCACGAAPPPAGSVPPAAGGALPLLALWAARRWRRYPSIAMSKVPTSPPAPSSASGMMRPGSS